MIKAIIFDCFGVFCVDSWVAAFNHFATDLDRQYTPFADVMAANNRGLIDMDEANSRIAEVMDITAEEWAEELLQFDGMDRAMLDYVLELKTEYRTALLTNLGPGRLRDFFGEEELTRHFDYAVASGDIGYIKPEPEAFEHMLEHLGIQAYEAVFVDDRESNVSGAKHAGLHSVLFRNKLQLKKELKVLLEA